jgi:anti-anti-sigma factor
VTSDANDRISREGPHLGQVQVGHRARGIALVTMRGEHDISTLPVLARALTLAAAHSNVVVDLSECSFIDCTVIQEFIKISETLRHGGERFMLVIPPSQAQIPRIAKMIPLDEIFEVHEATDAAIASLKDDKRNKAPSS